MELRDVVDAAAMDLALAFPGKTVYAEKIEQGFLRPCFFVSVTEEETPLMNERAQRKLHLTVDYHGEEGALPREAAAELGSRLTLVLEWLEIDGLPRRAQSMGYACREDGSLGWTAEYQGHVFKRIPQEKMGALRRKVEIHNRGY